MTDLLSIGKTGLFASKKSLETTGHNLANANTEGFSRQRTVQQTGTPVLKNGLIHGTGTRVKNVVRMHNEHVEKKLHDAQSEHSFFKERSFQLSQVEDVFNEINQDGLNKVLNKFFNAFRELANQPENETIRSYVRDSANLVVKDFKRIKSTLDFIEKNISRKVDANVISINQILNDITSLNKKIAMTESIGDEASDLRDSRDRRVNQLSEYFQTKVYQDGKGRYVVSADGVGTLVAGGQAQLLTVGGDTRNGAKLDGKLHVFFKGRPSAPFTDRIKGGELSAMFKVRDQDIKELRDEIDTVAFEFINSVNAVHRRGFINKEINIDQQGDLKNNSEVTGINFFEAPAQKTNAASNISLSKEVMENLFNITTALAPNSPGDNRIALAISKLQNERILNDGSTTLEEKYLQSIGKIGLSSGKARLSSEQSEGVLNQTISVKERFSGVSIDEEAANMVRYQHAYDASAKVMKTAEEMFQTILSIKR